LASRFLVTGQMAHAVDLPNRRWSQCADICVRDLSRLPRLGSVLVGDSPGPLYRMRGRALVSPSDPRRVRDRVRCLWHRVASRADRCASPLRPSL